MNKSLGYILTAIVSGIAGWFFCSVAHRKKLANKESSSTNPLRGTTTAKTEDGKYFLVYNGALDLSKEITQEEHTAFMSQYPLGIAPLNALNAFSSNAPKYTKKAGKYYEYIWDGKAYGGAIEITQEEYNFLTNKQNFANFIL